MNKIINDMQLSGWRCYKVKKGSNLRRRMDNLCNKYNLEIILYIEEGLCFVKNTYHGIQNKHIYR